MNFFYPMVKSFKHLYYLIKSDKNELNDIFSNIDSYYTPYDKPKIDLNGKPVVKNGKISTRTICPSIGKLKVIQRNIKRRILDAIDYPPHIQGGVKGKDNVTNASYHKGNKYFFVTDIKNFFPSISFKQVYEMFLDRDFSYNVSSKLTKLVTYKYSVPQGIPTSTHIANLISFPLDNELLKICKLKGLKYSRFVDDVTISSKIDFQEIVPQIIETIHSNDFRISQKKTHYKIGTTTVTGILVKNNYLKVPQSKKNRLNDKLKAESRVGLENYILRVEKK